MFIIDFDDTIFNTRPGFRRLRLAALAPFGISEELFNETANRARVGPSGGACYTNERHAARLAEHGQFDYDKIVAALATCQTSEKLRTLLFPDTISFLENLKKFGEPMVLLSLGDEEFQYQKVKGAGLGQFFDRMFFVNDTKEHVVGELLGAVSDASVWFINDRIVDSLVLHQRYAPRLRVVLKKAPERPVEEYIKSGLPRFETLTEIYGYIAKNR